MHSSHKRFLGPNFINCQMSESNPGRLAEKPDCYHCAMKSTFNRVDASLHERERPPRYHLVPPPGPFDSYEDFRTMLSILLNKKSCQMFLIQFLLSLTKSFSIDAKIPNMAKNVKQIVAVEEKQENHRHQR